MVCPVFLELDSTEEMHVGCVCAKIGEAEGNLRLGDCLILLRIVDEALLNEITASAAPAGPEAEFEERDGQRGCGYCPDHTDECLLAADFRTDILAEDCSLKVWKNEIGGHENEDVAGAVKSWQGERLRRILGNLRGRAFESLPRGTD